MSDAERVRVTGGASRCPFCHDGLEKPAEIVACAPCGARFHAGCHQANQGRCPACGATEVLVSPRRKARRRDPPAGSRIQVSRDEERTTFRWDPHTRGDTVLTILFAVMVITLPLAWLLWRARRRTPLAEVELGPDALTFDAINPHTFSTSRVTVGPQELGAVRVSGVPGGQHYGLTVDVGLVRHRVLTGLTGGALSAPEMEWLAGEILAWQAERQEDAGGEAITVG